MQISDEIRGILDEGKKPTGQEVTEMLQEPVDEALDLIRTHTNLTTLLQKKLDALSAAFGAAQQVATRAGKKTGEDRKQVFEVFEGAPLAALRELREVADKSIQHVENVCRRGRYRSKMPSYGGKWTENLDEARDPMGGSSDLQAYGDYVPAIGKIEPGDAVNLGGMVFRVIGKSGNSAVVQPEAVRQGVYSPARGYPTPQSPAPSGTTTPQDTRLQAPQGNLSNPTGRTSLVGTSVLKYNPHTGQFQFCTGRLPGDYEMADTIQVVGHDPALPSIAAESITPEKLEMMTNEAEGDDTIEKLRAVAIAEEPQLVNDVLVDPFTAEAAVEMYDGLAEGNQEQMEAMSIHDILRVTYSVMERAQGSSDEDPEDDEE
jgi:hypothetical protein